MTDLKAAVEKVSKRIEALESKRQRLSSAIRGIGNQEFRIGSLTRDQLINDVEVKEMGGRFAGVDGGLLTRSFHGIDLIVTRSVGVAFDYQKTDLKKSQYIHTDPRIFEVESGSPGDLILRAGLHRMEAEIQVAMDLLKKSPDYLLLDGPLYPHPSTRVAKSQYPNHYKKIIQLYNQLIKESKQRGCRTIGVVEDSRSRYFSNLLRDVIVPNLPPEAKSSFPGLTDFRDTALLYDALAHCQRTFTFKLKQVPDISYGKNIYAFYLKTAKYDRPIRVEFVSGEPQEDGARIAEVVLALSTFSTYGIPSVLIEADAKAKLTGYYMEYIERLLGRTTPLLMKLRREGRPI